MNVHFSSQRMDWQTPDAVLKELDKEFHFTGDPAPANHDIRYFDGLKDDWRSSNFVNPPYGRQRTTKMDS